MDVALILRQAIGREALIKENPVCKDERDDEKKQVENDVDILISGTYHQVSWIFSKARQCPLQR
ncbi:hypothetical protein CCACVL1_09937 [Corchorus capsularis]|uniref:Uncharacterized protein n=1 Tax=Corchorus capsularis TaxID=210143 RepID=A0A1R3ITI8_COCAP|nr:hypothetical protein CCACVL1_09937 [Corchorus capsularis]